jgi:UDP-N-acetylglucosamine 2-epimerase (non-hydrolysing)
MSRVFFEDLGLPEPDIYLGVGKGSHASQTARIMTEFEKICLREKPGLVVVVGDVNSTLACGIVAAKLLIPLAHVEAGLRSFDRSMPEEVNRIVTDSVSDYLFTTCEDANKNLEREGVAKNRIFFVGNTMIDTLLRHKQQAQNSKILERLSLRDKAYGVLTLHRPSNVDELSGLKKIVSAIVKISRRLPIIFPAHPRTANQIKKSGLKGYLGKNITLIEPLGYLDFLHLMAHSSMVLTDSGGIQEETTVLGVPCLTLRKNTERPITVTEGTNTIVGTSAKDIQREALKVISGKKRRAVMPRLWDGKAAERIIRILKERVRR